MGLARTLLLVLPLLLAAAGCSEEKEAAPPPTPALAGAERATKEPAPEPPADPVPRLSALFRGASAERVRAAGLAPPGESPQPTSASEPGVALANAGPSPESDAGPPPPPQVPPAELSGPAMPAEPEDREDDAAWLLPENPQSLVWRHPGPPASLKVTLLSPKGRAWPTRVRLETDGKERVATVTPLTPLPSKALFRLVAEAKGEDGSALLWSEPVMVKAGVDDAPPWTRGGR